MSSNHLEEIAKHKFMRDMWAWLRMTTFLIGALTIYAWIRVFIFEQEAWVPGFGISSPYTQLEYPTPRKK